MVFLSDSRLPPGQEPMVGKWQDVRFLPLQFRCPKTDSSDSV